MCDAFLVLAQAPGGLSCFFLPRVLPDGSLNALRIQRLKDKLGNKANASSEVEFTGASAWLVGEEGRGIPQILEMGTLTRLDCALGTSGLMRQALSLALHHTAQRKAFGTPLIEQPLMAQRAGRPGAGERGRHGAGHAPGARLRPARRSPMRR